ncbi:MAG TPA: hypothetical protein VIK77_06995 [Tissierellaceae bacterium]
MVELGEDEDVDIHFTNLSGSKPRNKLPVTAYERDGESKVIKRCPKGEVPIYANVKEGQESCQEFCV